MTGVQNPEVCVRRALTHDRPPPPAFGLCDGLLVLSPSGYLWMKRRIPWCPLPPPQPTSHRHWGQPGLRGEKTRADPRDPGRTVPRFSARRGQPRRTGSSGFSDGRLGRSWGSAHLGSLRPAATPRGAVGRPWLCREALVLRREEAAESDGRAGQPSAPGSFGPYVRCPCSRPSVTGPQREPPTRGVDLGV